MLNTLKNTKKEKNTKISFIWKELNKHKTLLFFIFIILLLLDFILSILEGKTNFFITKFFQEEEISFFRYFNVFKFNLFNFSIHPIILKLFVIFFRFLYRILIFRFLRTKIKNQIRSLLFNKQQQLNLENYNFFGSSQLLLFFNYYLEESVSIFGEGLIDFLDSIAFLLIVFCKMFFSFFTETNTYFLILSSFSLFSYFFFSLLFLLKIRKERNFKAKIKNLALEKQINFIQDFFKGLKIIKSFDKEDLFIKEFEQKNLLYYQKSIDMYNFDSYIELLINSFLVLIISSLYFFAFIFEIDWDILRPILNNFYYLKDSVNQLDNSLYVYSESQQAAQKIDFFLDKKQNNLFTKNTKKTLILQGNIKLKNLNFKYPNSNKLILKDISLQINKGEKIAIFGKTGSGKTTLIDLLLGLYEIEKGQIFFDQKDLKDIDLIQLRKNISLAAQETFLFSETINYNISFSFSKPEEEIVKEAAKKAEILETILQWPEQFNKKIIKNGINLSGGQKQRINLARALAKKNNILILDDSLSALDVETEKKVLHNINKNYRHKTVLIVTNKISLAKNMHKVIFLEEGQLLAFGTHEELLKNPQYKKINNLQQIID